MKKLLSGILAAVMLASTTTFAFEDIKGHKYEKEMADLKEWGYITGYEDNSYCPDRTLTRAEAAQMMRMAMYPLEPLEGLAYEQVFSDVTLSDWECASVYILSTQHVINGFPDGTFRPEENVTVAQALNMCLKMTGYSEYIEKDTAPWYEGVVSAAAKYGFTEGLTIEPEKDITRGEMAKLIHNAVNIPLVIVTGFAMSEGTKEPLPQIEIADGKDGRTFATLITNYTNIDFKNLYKLIAQDKETACGMLGLDIEKDLIFKGGENSTSNYEVTKTFRYNGRPVTLELRFWDDTLMNIVLKFENNPETAYEFAVDTHDYFVKKLGNDGVDAGLEKLTIEDFLAEENKSFSKSWSEINENWLNHEAWEEDLKKMEKSFEFKITVGCFGTGTQSELKNLGMVSVGMSIKPGEDTIWVERPIGDGVNVLRK